jgi:hypothetical protein
MAKSKKARRARRPARRPGAAGRLRAVHAAKRRIESKLHEHVVARHKHGPLRYRKHVDAELRNLVGIAVGHSHATDGATHAESAPPGEPVLLVLLDQPRRHSEVRALLKTLVGAKAGAAKALPFEVIVTGAVRAHAQAFKLRPAAPGTSIGNCAAPSGTFGFLARGRSAPRNSQLFVVSNCHVMVSEPDSPPVKGVTQPGRTDGGTVPSEQIATLEKAVPIRFGGGSNHVDAATALATPAQVRRELMCIQGTNPIFVPIGTSIQPATVGMTVGKSGRQTGVTMGRITSASASVIATYGIRTALFVDQILVMGTSGLFSDAGDSGSLVWTWDDQRNPVGLVFGGAKAVSFVNHISDVLDALDVDLA